MQDTSCAAGFLRAPSPTVDVMSCGEGPDGKRYLTCCLPNDPASGALEIAVVVLLLTHVWAEVAQQVRVSRRVEYENLSQFIKEVLSRYTHDIWNILDTTALFTAMAAGVTRAFIYNWAGILSPAAMADLHMFAIVLGFLRFMTVLQVFEFSGTIFLINKCTSMYTCI